MEKIKNWIENYWRACLFVAGLLALLILAVMGSHWSDLAKKPFWWTFWIVASIIAVPGFIGLIAWFNSTRNKW